MPSSHHYQINEIVELIVNTDPQSLLDIGAGFGKVGFLAREYLDVWDLQAGYTEWKRRIDGIEVFKEYLTPVHDYIYDNIYTGNAQEILPSLEHTYDLACMIDVLEHFTYEDGLEILDKILAKSRNLILSIPKDIGEQHDIYDNEHEEHHFQWKKKHFKKYPNHFFLPNPISLIVFIGEDAEKVQQKIRVERAKNFVKNRLSLIKPQLAKIAKKRQEKK